LKLAVKGYTKVGLNQMTPPCACLGCVRTTYPLVVSRYALPLYSHSPESVLKSSLYVASSEHEAGMNLETGSETRKSSMMIAKKISLFTAARSVISCSHCISLCTRDKMPELRCAVTDLLCARGGDSSGGILC